MPTLDDLPITDESEVRAFLDSVPIAVDRDRFTRFALGFPHRYLAATSPVEVLKHFALVTSLGRRAAISALSRDGEAWKLVVVARDRHALFARIAGSLAVFGANVGSAEAIANTEGIVLDVFQLADQEGRLRRAEERRRFQVFLEGVVTGGVDLEAALRDRALAEPSRSTLAVSWDDEAFPGATLLRVSGRDSLGLLYQVARHISEAGCDIELAHIQTPGGEVRDEFQLTAGGGKLSAATKSRLEALLTSAAVTPGKG